MITLTPFWNGLVKGLILSVLGFLVLYLGDPSHLQGLPSWAITGAPILVMLISAWESKIKASTGDGLFGASRVSRV